MDDKDLASTSNEIKNKGKELKIEVREDLETTLRPEICIYPVPVKLRRLNEAAYTPQLISIGPIHHGKEKLEVMETQKQRYYKEFSERLPKEDWNALLNDLCTTIQRCQGCIYNSYEDAYCYQDEGSELRKDQNAFSKMILWDAVFIFELFLKTVEPNKSRKRSPGEGKRDFIVDVPWLSAAIARDLILLENQLPFKILDKLYGLAAERFKTECSPFLKLSCKYFGRMYKHKAKPQETLHFTDLVRFFLSSEHPEPEKDRPSKLPKGGKDCPIDFLYRATWLNQAGMKFKPLEDAGLLDIRSWPKRLPVEDKSSDQKREGKRCQRNELHVPPLKIDDNTECLFRNLMALEQCHYPYEANICQYVKFLDFLVDNGEDADLFIESKVISHRLGESAAVADLINKLCLEIVEVHSCYSYLAETLNNYYLDPLNRTRAFLKREYFKNVWIGTATVAGAIVLVTTLVQFVRSFL